jgi:hypothetical protein
MSAGHMGAGHMGAGLTYTTQSGRTIGATTTPLPKYAFGNMQKSAPEPPAGAGLGGYNPRGYMTSATPQSVVSSAAPPPSAGSTASHVASDLGISFGANSFSSTAPHHRGGTVPGDGASGADLDAYIAQLDQRLHKNFGTPHSTRLGHMKRGREA